MPNLVLFIVIVITTIVGVFLILQRMQVISLKNDKAKITLYFLLIIGLIYISLSLFGRPLLGKINAYREGVLQESEEECKSENAPYWCHL